MGFESWQSEPFFNQRKYMNSCSFAGIFGFVTDLTSSAFVHFSSVKRLEESQNLILL